MRRLILFDWLVVMKWANFTLSLFYESVLVHVITSRKDSDHFLLHLDKGAIDILPTCYIKEVVCTHP